MKNTFAILALAAALCGCSNLHSVVTSTQTGLGVSISENPSTQLYEARLGYFRNEFAFVPGDTNHPGTVPDVLMEIRMENIFKGGLVYQRLAVGSTAVSQPGAALLFAKDANGQVSTNVAAALLSKTPSPLPDVTTAKLPLAQAYQKAADKNNFDTIAKNLGYESFASFLTNPASTLADVQKVKDALKNVNLIP